MPEQRLFARQALLADGWAQDVLFDIGDDGDIAEVKAGAAANGAPVAAGPILPGMINVHSHAFQRALAGRTERAGRGEDSFWTWRDAMYRFVTRLTPDHLEAIAAQLYIEMLKQGYTAVGEFHYLHHGPDGTPYDDIAEMSGRAIAAAKRTGIAITHMPVLYGYGGFGGAPVAEAQRRFHNGPDSLLRIVEVLCERHRAAPDVRIGLAPHSLRAVTAETLEAAVSGLHDADPGAPVHIHVAEQEKEVADCLAWSRARPVDWLYDHMRPDRRWCLIHATNISPPERQRILDSGAVAGICPTTEANLGDGLFPFDGFAAAGGIFAIGSDSHVSVSPIEELRWLEYGQRLVSGRRNIAASADKPSVGAALWKAAASGGAQALARPAGSLSSGARADLIVLDGNHVNIADRQDDDILDGFIFAGNDCVVRDVMVGGAWRVLDGHHAEEEAAAATFRATVAELLS
ncbi:MAG: formimidoylglutamate deiminase [Alphaproteobacteria bacterium]|nr:formimidoylglutamate deiminase [Alphaproteobacteria bacterium]